MKNEKFCFNKGTGLIALLGIVLVAAVFFMNYTTSQQQPTSTKAALGCPSGSAPDVINKCPTELTVVGTDGQPLTVKNPVTSTVYKCCYAPTTFSPKCPSGTAPDVINKCPTSLKSGIKTTFLATGTVFECCNYPTAWNPLGSGPVVATPVPASTAVPIVPTIDPRTTTQTCAPDATKFLPSNLGCSVCSSASNTKLTDFKNKLAGYFGGAANVPNYFAGGSSTAPGRVCYSMYTLPAKTGAKTTSGGSNLLCTDPSCVMCVNQVVDNKYCLGTKADCSPSNVTNKANLLAIVSDFNAKKYNDARTKLTGAFGLSNTQVTQDVVNQGLSNCYMYNADVYGATAETASFAFQPRGFCGHLQLATKYQGICTCAKMQNLDNAVCKDAMTQISALAQ